MQMAEPTGFRRFELGMEWFPTKDALLDAAPGPVLVGSSYSYLNHRGKSKGDLKQARKYAAFSSHWEYWEKISDCHKQGLQQNLHEVLPAFQPRCLYFDLDGDVNFSPLHMEIVEWLRSYVRWFFQGERMEWEDAAPEPVVLRSGDCSKYSCHVVFPQIQFRNYAQQREYMIRLLSGLSLMKLELTEGRQLHILQEVVDRVPYMPFQLFRGPYASKLKSNILEPQTQLLPEEFFRESQLSCFASHVDPDYALPLATAQELLDWNIKLQELLLERNAKVENACGTWQAPYVPHDLDFVNLYDPMFQQRGGGFLDLAGRTEVEVYEECLKQLHPNRCNQFWTWFRISGVTCWMLERFGHTSETRSRIWAAHHEWSRGYPYYCEVENMDRVYEGEGKRLPSLSLLRRLVRFDNPDMSVRWSTWGHALHYDPADLDNLNSSPL